MPGLADLFRAEIRPLRPEDAAQAAGAARAALEQLDPEREPLSATALAERVASGTARVAHLQRTDPGGCWVAEVDGQIVGTAGARRALRDPDAPDDDG